jgi:hypothetical protein
LVEKCRINVARAVDDAFYNNFSLSGTIKYVVVPDHYATYAIAKDLQFNSNFRKQF